MRYSLHDIANITNGQVLGESSQPATGIAFDSRQVQPGDLFVALVGQQDGHRFIPAALAKGAVAVLATAGHDLPAGTPAVLVPDSLLAMQQVAQAYLKRVAPKVVAITGSNGKTTTKDMVAAVLSTRFRTFKTPANFNNEIGLPVTILRMPADTEVLVLELGMDRPGQLTALSQLVQPDLAVITMIGEAHIEFFKTRAKIAQAKLEITAGLAPAATLLLPANEPLLTAAWSLPLTVQTFGPAPDDYQEQGQDTFFVDQGQRFAIPLLGRYNIRNAQAAIRVGQYFAIPLLLIAQALAHFQLTANRTEHLTAEPSGAHLISDVYNANPTAVKEVLQTVQNRYGAGAIYVLGDMLELGEQGPALHAGLLEDILAGQPKAVYLLGPLMSEQLAAPLRAALGDDKVNCYTVDQLTTLTNDLARKLLPTDVVLLKGSHGVHLERVVEELTHAQ
ncbi:UDP-N-acetylmuramoyl-tripeptide--D-alanyl-D-alanine ligase [Leuconostocaceae bacterium ESL0958]|nr:UDP-N-acetylmuramoyl-tripeptide--D-alanyl-D-alanine ligase [Leuconostocaceae bacterium ESL0958]